MAINFPTKMDVRIDEKVIKASKKSKFEQIVYGSITGFYILNYLLLFSIVTLFVLLGALIWRF